MEAADVRKGGFLGCLASGKAEVPLLQIDELRAMWSDALLCRADKKETGIPHGAGERIPIGSIR
ncbi:MAG: hypothetical protein QMB52_11950 [Propionivibrio sp.]